MLMGKKRSRKMVVVGGWLLLAVSSSFDRRLLRLCLVDGIVQDHLHSPSFSQGELESPEEELVLDALLVSEQDQALDELVNIGLHVHEEAQGIVLGRLTISLVLDTGEVLLRLPNVLPVIIELRVVVVVVHFLNLFRV